MQTTTCASSLKRSSRHGPSSGSKGAIFGLKSILNATATRTRISQKLLSAREPHRGRSSAPLPGRASSRIPQHVPGGFRCDLGVGYFWQIPPWKKCGPLHMGGDERGFPEVMISMVSEVAVNYMNIRALQQKIDLPKRRSGPMKKSLRS